MLSMRVPVLRASRRTAVQAALALLLLPVSRVAVAQVPEARVSELVLQARALAAASAGQASGTALVSAGSPTAGTVNLTVDEAVAHALERNLDIAVERINPQTFDYAIAALDGIYRPVLSSTVGTNYIVQLPTSQLIGGQRVENTTQTANVLGSWNLPWYGGAVTLGFNNRKLDSTNLFTTFTPQYNASVLFSYTQPLLRGLRVDLTRQQLAVTRINRDISDVQLRATVTSTLAAVRNAYWDLVAAREAIAVAQRSLTLAEKLVEDNRVRVEVGALAPLDVFQAQSEAATRRQSLVAAESSARTAELALKRLIVDGTQDPLWPARIEPVDRPDFRPTAIDLDGAIRNALAARTDLTQSRKQLEVSEVNARFLKDQTLPGLDFLANYGLQGIGGTRYIRQGTGGPVIDVIPGDYWDALDMVGAADYPQWTAQVNFSYPIGTSTAEASFERAKLQMNQARAQIRKLELQVATEVANIASQVENNLRRVEAATAARELAEKRLEAEQSKFEVGMSTNFFVVQAQRDLFDAQLTELRARLDYQKSLVDFDRVQQTSLSGSGGSIITASTTGTR
jgi:outer membrane protein TolC